MKTVLLLKKRSPRISYQDRFSIPRNQSLKNKISHFVGSRLIPLRDIKDFYKHIYFWAKILVILNPWTWNSLFRNSIRERPLMTSHLAIFYLPTYFVMLYNVPFWGLSWTLLPTLISDVINERSLIGTCLYVLAFSTLCNMNVLHNATRLELHA